MERALEAMVVYVLGPCSIRGKGACRAKYEERVFRASDGHIESLFISHESDIALRVVAYSADDDDVPLLTLECVHSANAKSVPLVHHFSINHNFDQLNLALVRSNHTDRKLRSDVYQTLYKNRNTDCLGLVDI